MRPRSTPPAACVARRVWRQGQLQDDQRTRRPYSVRITLQCGVPGDDMTKTRLEAFSDAVIAIIITIMVLELQTPEGADWHALNLLTPVFLAYVLSFFYLAIYWNNHHHLLHAMQQVSGAVLWANMHLLFWLSLIPFATAWTGEHYLEALPTAVYGVI